MIHFSGGRGEGWTLFGLGLGLSGWVSGSDFCLMLWWLQLFVIVLVFRSVGEGEGGGVGQRRTGTVERGTVPLKPLCCYWWWLWRTPVRRLPSFQWPIFSSAQAHSIRIRSLHSHSAHTRFVMKITKKMEILKNIKVATTVEISVVLIDHGFHHRPYFLLSFTSILRTTWWSIFPALRPATCPACTTCPTFPSLPSSIRVIGQRRQKAWQRFPVLETVVADIYFISKSNWSI